jgi:hypothetical protein
MTYQRETGIILQSAIRQITELDAEVERLEAEIVRFGQKPKRHQTAASAARNELVVGNLSFGGDRLD